MWFNLAASRATIQQLHALAVTARDTVVARMTPVDLSEAQRLARSGTRRTRSLDHDVASMSKDDQQKRDSHTGRAGLWPPEKRPLVVPKATANLVSYG